MREKRYAAPGSTLHLKRLIRKFEAIGDRPRINPEDRSVLSGVLRQELVRRRIIQSEAKRWEKLGIDINILELPEWKRFDNT